MNNCGGEWRRGRIDYNEMIVEPKLYSQKFQQLQRIHLMSILTQAEQCQ